MGGIKTNLSLFRRILDNADFRRGKLDTGFLDRLLAEGPVEVKRHEQGALVAALAAGIFSALESTASSAAANNGARNGKARSAWVSNGGWKEAGRLEALGMGNR